ncbi:hypothetical protein QJS04_geneDACA002845 [Acorus gramineus]|uniref:Uncharacterized protein n=1 Tax=Acorus gramineus TaxID=55184 RepID=A0AAV9BYL5_ACOGR|nr:hypothetical protein QJS04_geneDACA002845 [Acorus gramineus]
MLLIFWYNYDLYKIKITQQHSEDSLAEWSKAPDLGSGPKGRGFKSHSCHFWLFIFFYFFLVEVV